jgi:hypothetical protein
VARWIVIGVLLGTLGCEDLADATGVVARELDLTDPEPDRRPPPQPVWTYTDAEGRPAFVGSRNMVPPEHRAEARELDLSDVSLNHALGRQWDEQVRREHERLSETPYCEGARQTADAGVATLAWRDYGHFIGIGAVALLLLVTAPWVARQVGGALWIRALLVVFPLLGFLAILTHVAVRSAASMDRVRHTADLCTPDGIDSSTPRGRAERMGVVQQLTARIQASHDARDRFLADQMEYETDH